MKRRWAWCSFMSTFIIFSRSRTSLKFIRPSLFLSAFLNQSLIHLDTPLKESVTFNGPSLVQHLVKSKIFNSFCSPLTNLFFLDKVSQELMVGWYLLGTFMNELFIQDNWIKPFRLSNLTQDTEKLMDNPQRMNPYVFGDPPLCCLQYHSQVKCQVVA